MVLAAEFAMIGWVSPGMLAASRCGHASSIDPGSITHDLIALAEPDMGDTCNVHLADIDSPC